MKIVKIELTNYGPFYGTHSFSFDSRGLLLVMGDNQDEPRMDSNGSGKSHVFDALDWCLFPKVPRGDHVDSVINDEAKSCSVTTYLENDRGQAASITRKRGKKNELQFVLDGVDRSALDMNETQRLIEDFLGLDRDVFHAAVLFGQTDLARYADSSDTERMATLTKILQLDEIDVLLGVAKERLTTVNVNLTKLETQLAEQEGRLGELRSADFRDRIEQWERARREDLARWCAMLADSERELYGPQAESGLIPQMEADVTKLIAEQGNLRGPDNTVLNALQDQLSGIRSARAHGASTLTTLAARIRSFEEELAKPQPVCTECNRPVSRDHVEAQLAAVRADYNVRDSQIRNLDDQIAAGEIQLSSGRAERERLEAVYRDKYNQYTQAIGDLRARIQAVHARQAQLEKAARTVQELRMRMQKCEQQVNPFVVQQNENQARIAGVVDAIAELERKAKAVREEVKYMEFWVTAFGPKGLKSYILDFRLQELTDAANQWVRLLTGGTIWVQFEAQKQTRGKKLVNSPDVRVCRWNPDGSVTERNFKSWSGGEKQRISFAIDFGLSRLIANRAKHRYDLLILDEVFRHLDRSGKEAVMEMLTELAREKSSVIVVEHDTDFQDSFESRIVIRKKDRRSVILEENDEQAKYQGTDGDLSTGGSVCRQPVRSPVRRVSTSG